MEISVNNWKNANENNPISSNVFCADPTAVEYEGRIYVYGTNDHQQYFNAEKNTYEKINSLVCFSSDDMVNWTYHGEINVGKIAPWIYNSWAPSICKRVEEDGLTHFYLYFSNSGTGVGVITATSPTGPWSDPLKKPLIIQKMPGLDSPDPFDPGVCIDDKGTGWLAFGGGVVEGHNKVWPGSSKIIKLGKDMLSIDSDFVNLKAPYFFEASEMNFINGTYVYTFNNNWEDRTEWPLPEHEPFKRCTMAYMTSKTPLDSDSWVYRGSYLNNPGEMGQNFDYSNNHTHYEKYNGQWYIFYHTLSLQEKSPTKGGFRSMCVDKISIDEETVTIHECTGTRKGVDPIKNFNPYNRVQATTMSTSADIWYEDAENPEKISIKSMEKGAWVLIKNADFGQGCKSITAKIKGSGKICFFADSISQTPDGVINAKEEYEIVSADLKAITGVHDFYIWFENKGTCIQSWQVQ